jgi:hypothetical protein
MVRWDICIDGYALAPQYGFIEPGTASPRVRETLVELAQQAARAIIAVSLVFVPVAHAVAPAETEMPFLRSRRAYIVRLMGSTSAAIVRLSLILHRVS